MMWLLTGGMPFRVESGDAGGASGRSRVVVVVRPSSFFVVAGHRVPVMWVLAVNRQWAVDRGGAVLVGCHGNRRGGAAYHMQKDERR